jgi:hypothetical protein
MAVAMSGMVAVIALLCVAVASIATLYAARAQATNAADSAALAAAVATYPPTGQGMPSVEARYVAELNGAKLLSCDCRRDGTMAVRTAQVMTAIRTKVPLFGEFEVRGIARAEFDPRRWLGR